jgi:hypothetical protein
MPRRAAVTILLLALCGAAPYTAQLDLDSRAIDEAIAIGQSRLAAERTRYHEPYRLIVARPPVDYIDVVTPFRRIVLGAQARAEIGDRGFGQRDALELLAAAPDQVDLRIELTFHPLNTYIGVPDYRVTIEPPAGERLPPVLPRTLERVPRFGARLDGMPLPSPAPAAPATAGSSQPMLGGTVIARFDGRLLAGTASTMVISENGGELVRVRLDLATLR